MPVPDTVTKKELQAVEKSLGKQISELQTKLDDMKKSFNSDIEELNKIEVNIKQELSKRIEEVDSRCNDLQNGINTLAKAIADVAKKVGT